jgi:hypothetical protein
MDPTGPIACRRCLDAQYLSGYPARRRNRRLAQLLTGFLATGAIEEAAGPALDVLLAKRRRGVRRGRRVQQRAIRELARLPTRLTRAVDLLETYEALKRSSARCGGAVGSQRQMPSR